MRKSFILFLLFFLLPVCAFAQHTGATSVVDSSGNGPTKVKPPIGTATVPPTFTTAGATNADASLTTTLSPNSLLPAIIQKTSGTGSGSQASLATSNFTTNPTAGNALVAVVGVGNNGTVKVTDTIANSWTQALCQLNGSTFQACIFYATNIKGGATDACTVTPSASVSLDIECYEVSGIIGVGGGGATNANSTANQQNSVDSTASNSGTSVSPTTGTGQTLYPNEIAFAGIAIGTADQTPSAFAPWNKDADLTVGGTPSGLFGLHIFSQPMGSPTDSISLSATITSEPWAAAFAAFKGAELTISGVVTGDESNNSAAAGSTNLGVLPCQANAAAPAWTEGNQVLCSVFLNGSRRSDLSSEAGTAVTNTPTAIGTLGTGNVISVNADLTSVKGTATVTSASGVQRVGIAGSGNAVLDAVTTAATTPANGVATLVSNVTTAPSLTTGQSVAVQGDYQGSLFVKPYRRGQTVAKGTALHATTSATTVLAAQSSGIFADISEIIITIVVPASTDTAFTTTLSDGTASYVFNLDTGATSTATAAPPPIIITFNPPLPATSAATAWTMTNNSLTPSIDVIVVAILQKAS